MRRILCLAILACQLGSGSALADPATRARLIHHFGSWYSYFPGSRVSVRETSEMAVARFEAYRVQRHSDSKRHQEANVALVDPAHGEVFVGRVFHDDTRAAGKRPFDTSADLSSVQAHLTEAYGLPVQVSVKGNRGALREISIAIQQVPGASVSYSGFISEDGASLLLGEFHSLNEGAEALRRRLLSETPGVRSGSGGFTVVEFLDFQCDRCGVRTPEVRKFVSERGGAVEVHLLPLTKVHPWAFAAAESAAALANLSPHLFEKYEEGVFARAEGMNEKAARELASDIAEAAGWKKEFEEELASGRARERVLSDIRLAMRLGITGTPYFLYEGVLFSGERDLLETYLREKLPAREPKPAAAAR